MHFKFVYILHLDRKFSKITFTIWWMTRYSKHIDNRNKTWWWIKSDSSAFSHVSVCVVRSPDIGVPCCIWICIVYIICDTCTENGENSPPLDWGAETLCSSPKTVFFIIEKSLFFSMFILYFQIITIQTIISYIISCVWLQTAIWKKTRQ